MASIVFGKEDEIELANWKIELNLVKDKIGRKPNQVSAYIYVVCHILHAMK